jgi:hypothetical protein
MQELSPLRGESAKQIAARRGGLETAEDSGRKKQVPPLHRRSRSGSGRDDKALDGGRQSGNDRRLCYDLVLGIFQLSEGPILEEMSYA